MPNRPKNCAYSLLLKKRQYKKLMLDDLYEIIEEKGFKVIEYKKYNYTKEFRALIDRLGIEKEIQENDSLFYCNNNLKFIFLRGDVSNEDKYILLSHEIAHIYDNKILDSELLYTNAQKENFANEFTHYLTKPSLILKVFNFLIKKPLVSTIAMFIIASSVGVSLNHNINFSRETIPAVNLSSTSTIYQVTSTGEKYHKDFCKHVKYKLNTRDLTFEDAISEGYLPCLDCIGEEI